MARLGWYFDAYGPHVGDRPVAVGPGPPSAAYQAFQSGIQSAREQTLRNNQSAAASALTFARTQINDMPQAERARAEGELAAATAEVYRPKTMTEVATNKAAVQKREQDQYQAVRDENARTGGKDPGGEWYKPSAWGVDTGGVAAGLKPVVDQMNFLVKAALVGGGIYLAVKLVGLKGR